MLELCEIKKNVTSETGGGYSVYLRKAIQKVHRVMNKMFSFYIIGFNVTVKNGCILMDILYHKQKTNRVFQNY